MLHLQGILCILMLSYVQYSSRHYRTQLIKMAASLASSSLACGLSKLVVATTILLMKTCTLMSHTPVGGSRENAFFNSCLLHLQSIVVFSWKEFHCLDLLCKFGIEYLGSSEPFIALFMQRRRKCAHMIAIKL